MDDSTYETPTSPYSEDIFGNIVFGGLPLNCGPEVATHHLEAVAHLGCIIESPARQLLVEQVAPVYQGYGERGSQLGRCPSPASPSETKP